MNHVEALSALLRDMVARCAPSVHPGLFEMNDALAVLHGASKASATREESTSAP